MNIPCKNCKVEIDISDDILEYQYLVKIGYFDDMMIKVYNTITSYCGYCKVNLEYTKDEVRSIKVDKMLMI